MRGLTGNVAVYPDQPALEKLGRAYTIALLTTCLRLTAVCSPCCPSSSCPPPPPPLPSTAREKLGREYMTVVKQRKNIVTNIIRHAAGEMQLRINLHSVDTHPEVRGH